MARRGTAVRGAACLSAVAAALLTGCAAGSSGPAGGAPTTTAGATTSASASATSAGSAGVTASASAAASSSDGASVAAISVSIAGGKVSPAPDDIDVKAGSTVRLTVTSDVADEVHVHGVDKEFALAPGRPGSITFTVTDPGVYEVETHKTGKTLLHLVVR